MSTQQAIRLGDLRRYPGWYEPAVDTSVQRPRSNDSIVYLRDDLTVAEDSFGFDRPLFSDPSIHWYRFCVEQLGLEAPAFQLHPLNRQFTWSPRKGPFRRLTEAQMRDYDELGYTVVRNVFDEATLAAVTADIDRCEANVERSLKRLKSGEAFIARPDEITFSSHIVKRSSLVKRFVCSSFFQDISMDLIGPDVRLYWDQSVYKKPGVQEPFPWHQDNGYTFVVPQQYLTIWIALTDANEDNGCIWVAPKLHRLGTLAHRRTSLGYVCFEQWPAEAIAVPARAGDVVLFSSVTPHVTEGNRTSETRKAYILQFVPDGSYSCTVDEQGREGRVDADLPDRQFHVLRNGRAVDPMA